MDSFSLIVPLYNSQDHLQAFSEKLNVFLSNNSGYRGRIELVLVIDGANINYNNELKYIQEVALLKPQVYYSEENKGQLNATTFGLTKANGQRVITLDVDYHMIDNIFKTVFQEYNEDLVLFDIKERHKPFLRKVGAELNHYVYTMFFKSNKYRGSSLRSMSFNYLQDVMEELKSNYKLLDQILILNTDSIRNEQLETVYSQSSYSARQLISLFVSNLVIRFCRVESVLKPYKKMEL